jgi:hypothetical protein
MTTRLGEGVLEKDDTEVQCLMMATYSTVVHRAHGYVAGWDQ